MTAGDSAHIGLASLPVCLTVTLVKHGELMVAEAIRQL